MKKLLVFVLVLFCMAMLVACNAESNEATEDFIGIVTQVNNSKTSYIVKVTDSGSCNLEIGDRVIIQTADEGFLECAVGDCIKVEFNGVVEETIAISIADKNIPSVFSIVKIGTAETGAE